MPLYLFLILPFIAITTVHAVGQCYFNSTPTLLSPFPTMNYLSYNESTKFVLDNYFTGINLSFSYDLSDLGQPQQVQKTLEYTNGYLLDSLPQLAESQLINVYWDDSNVTSVAQEWTSDSLLLFLSEANSVYTLIVGSFDNIQASNVTDTPMYSSIIIQPPNGSAPGSQLQCSTIIPVGELQYYIDCELTDSSTGTVDNYFYYIAFPAYPPSDYTVTPILNNMTIQYSPIMSARVIVSASAPNQATDLQNNTYLVRYYNGLLLPPSSQANITTIEVFNVTDPLTPILVTNYNTTIPGMAPIANISSIQVSPYFMYIASAQGSIIILNDWYEPEQFDTSGGLDTNIVQQYTYDEMIFATTNLRIVNSGGQIKETFIVIGVLNSVNLTGLLFVSQTFQEFYTIPLPPFKQTTLNIQVYSVALGEDFAGISYSVSETFSDSACYYYAIADISFDQSNDCHTLWSFEKSNYIAYSKMNPAIDTDILFVLGMDNQYSNYSIFRPAFALYDNQESTQATLNIQSYGYNSTINFSLVVLSPNDQGIYLDLDSSSDNELETVAFQTNSDYLVFLNQSIYGPQLNFAIESNAIDSFHLYTYQQIEGNFTIEEGNTFLSMHRRHVSTLRPLLLIETTADNETNLRLGTITGSSIFNITSLNLNQEKLKDIEVIGYFYINGYDILLYNGKGANAGITMFYLDVEKFFQGNKSTGFNVGLQMYTYQDNITNVVLTQANGNIQAILISNTTLYVGLFQGNSPAEVDGSVSTQDYPFPEYPAFTPTTIVVHTAYPDIVFITTTAGNITYIIDYSEMIVDPSDVEQGSDIEGIIEFNIIFAQHPANSAEDVIVQPFTNNLFYIFPALNVIEHWDLSVVRSPFFRRNLDLFSYDLSVLTNSFVQQGTAFSLTTDTLYILAQDNDDLYVLVLKPTPANSYIVQAIQIPFDLNSPQNISIDVTETENFVYGNLLGDILVVLIGSNYHFWEIYSTPYLTFPVRTADFDVGMINVEYNANFTVENPWNVTQVPMQLSIYQNEKQLSATYPEINITSTDVNSVTFELGDLWSGTVFNFSIQSENNSAVSITPFMYFTNVSNFSANSEQVEAVIEMTTYTYYLTSEEIILVNNTDPTITHQIEIVGPSGCSMYIDPTETYGTAICGPTGQQGLFPFYLQNFFSLPCNFITAPSFQDIFIDANNSLMFLLMQAADGGNSNITVYNIEQSICNLTNPVFVMQGWSFSGSCPNFGEFDVLVMSSSQAQVIYMLFVLDLNFGLRIINYASMINLVPCVYSYSFEQLYQYLGPSPNPLEFCDVKLLQNECNLGSLGTCNANLLIVAHNFHAMLLQMQFENSGLEMATPTFTVFLVPSDYWIDDYEISGDLLILLGRNITQPDPGLDMLAYNISSTNYLQNGLDTEDPTIYQVPMWVTPLVADAEDCPEYPLVHPTISLKDDEDTGIYMLSFPNLQNQSTVGYNITSNITVSWNNESVIEYAPINLVIANNFQEVTLPVMFMRDETGGILEPEGSKEWFYIGCAMVGLGLLILILLAIWCYRKTYKSRIQYSRKLQKDPLRELMMY